MRFAKSLPQGRGRGTAPAVDEDARFRLRCGFASPINCNFTSRLNIPSVFTASSYNIFAQKSRDSGKFAEKYVKIPFTKILSYAIIDTNKNEKRKIMLTPILAILLATLGNGIHQIEGIMIKKYNSKHTKGGFIFTAILSLFAMLFFLILDLVTDRTGLYFPPK